MKEKVYVSFTDSIHKIQFDEFQKTCIEATEKYSPKELHVLFSSPGGDINLAFVLYYFLKALPTEIIMHGSGNIDSCGINVFLAGNKRYATKGTNFLLHNPTRHFGKDDTFTAEQLYSEFNSLQKDQERVAEHIIENTDYTRKELRNALLIGQTLNSEQAKEKNIISEIKEFSISQNSPLYQVTIHKGGGNPR